VEVDRPHKRRNDSKRVQADEVKRRRLNGQAGPAATKSVVDATTPLWRKPYREQLELKERNMRNDCLLKARKRISKTYRNAGKHGETPKWLRGNPAGFLESALRPVLASPALTFYRNKCEFTFGTRPRRDGEAGMEAELGFRTGSFYSGDLRVETPTLTYNVPLVQKIMVLRFRDFMRANDLPPYDNVTNAGLLRMLTLRSSYETGDILACFTVCLKDAALAARWDEVKALLPGVMEAPLTRGEAEAVYASAAVEAERYAAADAAAAASATPESDNANPEAKPKPEAPYGVILEQLQAEVRIPLAQAASPPAPRALRLLLLTHFLLTCRLIRYSRRVKLLPPRPVPDGACTSSATTA